MRSRATDLSVLVTLGGPADVRISVFADGEFHFTPTIFAETVNQ
jgi:hypothetical protein